MQPYLLGIDVGSTTTKLAVLDPQDYSVVFSRYKRHFAEQKACVRDLLAELEQHYPTAEFELALCGSGAKPIADHLAAPFVQEVVANAIALKARHPEARTAIELGGQDAKIIFFYFDENTQQLIASDMRMNGVCAGGTGAFIDEIAELLQIPAQDFNTYAEQASKVFHVSGRCGVFAKTDIQPLLNQGIGKADLALSTLHAVAKQTIGGLAQGNTIKPPVVFEGGPLTFNPKLINVFAEHLNLSKEDIIVPEQPETIVAYGCALALETLLSGKTKPFILAQWVTRLDKPQEHSSSSEFEAPYFATAEGYDAFTARHKVMEAPTQLASQETKLNVYLGIDSGSTTTKFVLLDENEDLVYSFYANNQGQPLDILRNALSDLKNQSTQLGIELNILGVGTTGYGEELSAAAFNADYHAVETVAHAKAALKYQPKASFVLDIGGQDMKAIFVHSGVITAITLNESCSSGCGAFIETFAKSLEVPVEHIAEQAFSSKAPAQLGSRCTVFMRSKVISEQKNGKSPADILAGLCKSVIQNVFTKVIRLNNLDALGDQIVVQGGTFRNNAILRAMELHSQKNVTRSPYPELMGAIGIALLTKEKVGKTQVSSFVGLHALEAFEYHEETGQYCPFCANHCNRTIVTFSDGRHFVQGNRCERGEIIGEVKDKVVQNQVREANKRINAVANLVEEQERLILKPYPVETLCKDRETTIGIPLALESWLHLPFWRGFFTALGFKVQISEKSSYALYEKALASIPSDTVCFPAKLAHGHVQNLLEQGVDRIFTPIILSDLPQHNNLKEDFSCAILHGYPLVLKTNIKKHIPHDAPTFIWKTQAMRDAQLAKFLKQSFGIPASLAKKAIAAADACQKCFQTEQETKTSQLLKELERSDSFAIVLAMRPYHTDHLVNHDVAKFFTRLGIPVIPADALPNLADVDLSQLNVQLASNVQAKLYAAATLAAQHPKLELAQIVSFGCGHDAIVSDEISSIMQKAGKEALILKLDESDVKGPLRIRISSFVNTVEQRRQHQRTLKASHGVVLPIARFEKEDRNLRTIYLPNLSEGFSHLMSAVLESRGFHVKVLPLADKRAIELGKLHLHNDICFPAQLNVGEFLRVLEEGQLDSHKVAFGIHQNCKDCRAGQYALLARKALDDAGYPDIPIVTSGEDLKGLHPGFSLDQQAQIKIVWGLAMLDALEDLRRSVRAYETQSGSADIAYQQARTALFSALQYGIRSGLRSLRKAVNTFNTIPVDRTSQKPIVVILGEILVAVHPSSNYQLEHYLEANGMEVRIARLSDFFHRAFLAGSEQKRHYFLQQSFFTSLLDHIGDQMFEGARRVVERIMKTYIYYQPRPSAKVLYAETKSYLELMHFCGEGWLIAGEMMHAAKHNVQNFVILQPFGCLPAHVYGRGMIQAVKQIHPQIQVLALDFDPDTSLGNIENRLQMLIMNAQARETLITTEKISNAPHFTETR